MIILLLYWTSHFLIKSLCYFRYGKPRAASVIALTDGKLWALDRRVFKRVVLRPKDFRRDIIKILKKVELLKCLDVTQLQRLVDLLNEGHYKSGDYIITQGEKGETFYIVEHGTCDCVINIPDQPPKTVMKLQESSYFGERALLESKPRAANVIATSDVDVLYIDKTAFEEVFGSLNKIIDEDRARREAIALMKLNGPQQINDVTLQGIVSTDSLGPLLLGSFKSTTINLCCRTFLLSDVVNNHFVDSTIRYLECAKILQSPNFVESFLTPKCISIIKQSNAIHLVLNSVIISDLGVFIRSHDKEIITLNNTENNASNNGNNNQVKYMVYLFACIVNALEILHNHNIIYRNVQPEGLYLDANGRIVLIDYRFSKIGLSHNNPNSKTFTICGASDYLSPEQISQIGHSYCVDLWSLGVLLYELTVGAHPFSSNTEVATYSKISQFGTKSFPALKFPDVFDANTKSLINQLLVPIPEARIGANGAFHQLKKHAFFSSFTNYWDTFNTTTSTNNNAIVSPFIKLTQMELKEILDEGMDNSLVSSFDKVTVSEEALSWVKNLDI